MNPTKKQAHQIITFLINLTINPKYTVYFAPLIWVFDLLLTFIIIKKIPYTEIDWTAYMEQIEIINTGERDYLNIRGGTGPLVYPAGHVRIFSIFYKLTDNGSNLRVAQYVFYGVYMLTLLFTMIVYILAQAPPWTLPLLVLSKRLHSIYVLRLFNDCFTTLFVVISIMFFQLTFKQPSQRKKLTLLSFGTFFYSISTTVKMNAILYFPGILIVFFFATNESLIKTLILSATIVAINVLVAWDFLFTTNVARTHYLEKSFELGRKFFFKWTVNWRFVPEDVFLSDKFAISLLLLQVFLLVLFATTRWVSPLITKRPFIIFVLNALGISKNKNNQCLNNLNVPRYILKVLTTSNLIGILCARSLHYQFYSWFAWSFPFSLYLTNLGPIIPVLWLLQEFAWNVFPSTNLSSGILISSLVVVIGSIWFSDSKFLETPQEDITLERKEK